MVFADLFAGTGVVSGSFKKQGYSIIVNDIQYYSYVITKHMIENNGNLNKSRCNQLIEELDPSYKRKARLNLKGSSEFHLAAGAQVSLNFFSVKSCLFLTCFYQIKTQGKNTCLLVKNNVYFF